MRAIPADRCDPDKQEPTKRASEIWTTDHKPRAAVVAALARQHGKQAVLGWLSGGLPADLFRSTARSPHNGTNEQPPGKKPE